MTTLRGLLTCRTPCAMFAAFALLLLDSRSLHAQIATDGSLGAQTTLSGPNYVINTGLGQQRGANLFHSFSTFSIGSTESATFETASGTANIIARVTGGFGSQIDGALNANANLFLLNPQGILVGASASINVAGSLHLSTADYLRFDNNTRFHASLGASSVLTTAAPSAFGFLDSAVAPIRLNGTALNLSSGQTLSLIGGEVTLDSAEVTAPAGRVNLVAAAGPGEVVMGPGTLNAATIADFGDVRLDDASINSSGVEGANIFIRAGQFVMERGSQITGSAGQGAGARVVDIEADTVSLRSSRIEYGPASSTSGAPLTTASIRATDFVASDSSVLSIAGGGDLSIAADLVRVDSGSSVGTAVAAGSRAGSLAIAARSVSVNAGTLTTLGGDGDAGDIAIEADTVDIRGGGLVISTTNGAGNGGAVSIAARDLTIDGSQSTAATGVSAGSLSAANTAGDAGRIVIEADTLSLRDGFVSSVTQGPGRGGDIRITADSISMDRGATVSTETGVVGSNGAPSAFGDGGAIAIDATTLQLSSGARISASTLANGQGGSIAIDAAQLSIDSAGAALATGITANSGSANVAASGNGGALSLNVNELQIRNQGQIASNAYGVGNAGRVEVNSNTLAISSGGVISASSFGQAVDAGSANDILIVAQQLDIDDFAQITNSTTGVGDAGQLFITAERVRIANGGLVQASSLSQSSLAGAVGDITIDSQSVLLSGGSINARSFGAATPGTIEIDAFTMTLDDGAVVSTTSAGVGDAGFIAVRVADTLRLTNSSRITTEALQGSGGNVRIVAGHRLLLSDSAISTSVLGATSNGGNIFVDPIYVILGNSQIIARAVGGNGGAIDLSTQILIRDANSTIDASSALGISGRVDIAGLDVHLDADFAPLSVDFLDAPRWQTSPCANRGNASRFTVAGRDGAYRSSLDYLQSPLSLGTPTRQVRSDDSFLGDTALTIAASLPSFATRCYSGG